MEVIKKINNNVAIALDNNQREVVLFGKGVGFPKTPYTLDSMKNIDRTFYGIDEKYLQLINEIDLDTFEFVAKMIDVVKANIDGNWNPHLTFILADHLNFAYKRTKKNMTTNFPYSYDLEEQYPEYVKLAKWIVKNFNKHMHIRLEKGEVSCVAMHLINNNTGNIKPKETENEKTTRYLREITRIIEDYFNMEISRKNFNYYRFRHHVQYFVRRKEEHDTIEDDNMMIYDEMIKTYPETYECVLKINEFLIKEYGESCSNNELLYLMIHINRLVSKEGL